MNNLKSYTEYAVTTPTTDFVIGFDFNYGTDAVNVTVNGVPATEAGYTVVYLNSTTMRLSPAVPSGVVRLERETDIDVPDNRFTAGAKFIASNVDENFTQIRHAQQEVRDAFDYLEYNTLGVVEAAKDATERANTAAEAVEDLVLGIVPASTVEDMSGKTQQELNNVFRTSQVIDTRLYGVVANTFVDMTPFIHDAFTANPKSRVFYFPAGEILCNIVIPRGYISLQGQGLGVTKLIGFDGSKSTINYNKKLYMGLKDISVHHRHNATVSIINARDSRYIVHEEVEVLQLPDNTDTYHFTVRGLDMRKDTVSWTGYNYFKKSRYNRCSYGIDVDCDGDVASVMQFDDCVIAWNGYFGARLIGAHVGGMDNCDIATNGQIGVRDGLYDETQFGGVYIKGRYFHITKAWHEYNRSKFADVDVPNDVYFHPDCVNCTETNPRRQRGNNGAYIQKQSQAQNDYVSYDDTTPSSGMGKERPYNLINNGAFKYALSGWSSVLTDATASVEYSDLPTGFETGIKVVNTTTGIRSLYQTIRQAGGGGSFPITDVSKWLGRTITCTFWVKNIGVNNVHVRAGFDTATGSVNFSEGSVIIRTPVGEWVKVTLTHTISASDQRILVGIRSSNSFITTGWACNFGTRVNDYTPKAITEDGGKAYGEIDAVALKKNGVDVATTADIDNSTRVRSATEAAIGSATSAINTDKRHPSFVFNSTTGKMYFSTGALAASVWRCTDGTGDITPV